jgi:hypothetical protein
MSESLLIVAPVAIAATQVMAGGYTPAQAITIVLLASAVSIHAVIKTEPPMARSLAIAQALTSLILGVGLCHIAGIVTRHYITIDDLSARDYAVAWSAIIPLIWQQVMGLIKSNLGAIFRFFINGFRDGFGGKK